MRGYRSTKAGDPHPFVIGTETIGTMSGQSPRAQPDSTERSLIERRGGSHAAGAPQPPLSTHDRPFDSDTPSSPLLQAHAPDPCPPTTSSLGLGQWVFAGRRQSRLDHGPSRRYLHESFLGCPGPCHGGPLGARARYFPNGIGLPSGTRGRRPARLRSATSERGTFRDCSHSLIFGPPK